MNKDAAAELLIDGVVRLEKIGHVARVTLNRPDARNAINRELSLALGRIIERVASDDDFRAVVLQGAGKAFCAGQDLKALDAGEPLGLPEHPEWGYAGFVEHRIDKPVVAAVHGFAFGGGFELALAADLIVLGESARLGLPEVTLGLFAAAGGVPRIAQQIPPKIAARKVFTGEHIDSAEAARWGLVSEVVPDDEVASRALELATTIAGNGPLAVQASKRILRDLATADTWNHDSWATINAGISTVFASADAAEGVRAFVERRPPLWQGR
jgi:crotonobetainyl-CoA hydratase